MDGHRVKPKLVSKKKEHYWRKEENKIALNIKNKQVQVQLANDNKISFIFVEGKLNELVVGDQSQSFGCGLVISQTDLKQAIKLAKNGFNGEIIKQIKTCK